MGSKGKGAKMRMPSVGGPSNMLKQVQQLQAQMQQAQEELATETVTSSVGGGAVSVVMTGQQEIKSVKIDPQAANPEDVEMLQDLIVAAVNDALTRSREVAERKMAPFTNALRIPGLM
jgi:nucleoid-associated protein EbfC